MLAGLSSPGAASAALALAAAATWGGGDFSGGVGVKAAGGTTAGALRVVIAGHAISLLALLAVLASTHAALPHGTALAWGLGGGVVAGLSLTAFYIALARGEMGVSAAVSGLITAAIPAAVSAWTEGAPSALRLSGFACAAVAIWLIAAPSSTTPNKGRPDRSVVFLAILGGIGFGIYFVALKQANGLGEWMPLTLARVGSLGTCVVLLLAVRLGADTEGRAETEDWLSRGAWMGALGIAVLDTAGNLLYTAATRTGRLDVAAVLAALYPASTILLAAVLLQERPSRRQWTGMAVALVAVMMVTL